MPKVAPAPEEPDPLEEIAEKWLDPDHGRQHWFESWQHGELMDRPLFNFEETGVLQVLVVNWNMHGKSEAARNAPCALFPNDRKHHLYVVGTAECEKSIPKAMLHPTGPKKKTWEKAVRKQLDGCVCIAEASLAATHLSVFARDDIGKYISNVKIDSVCTGWKGILGNKGGIRISMDVGGSNFLFIQSHLPSGQDKVKKRNESAAKILGSPTMGAKKDDRAALKGSNHVFFLGDLNFRVNCEREDADKYIAMGDHVSLLENDQLTELKRDHPLWRDFEEGAITFPPTYKYNKGTEYYDTSKKRRIPSWTDRILYLDNDKDKVKLIAYNVFKDIRSSDHKPVFAQFDVQVPGFKGNVGECPPPSKHYEARGCSIM